MPRWLLGTFLFFASTLFAHADEPKDGWPHWRGPHANGTAPHADPPLTWDEKTNIKWKAPLPGRGSATPIVWGDQVFVVTAIKTDRVAAPAELPKLDPDFQVKTKAPTNYHQFVVLAFDKNTGKLRWRQLAAEKVPHEGHHASHSYAAGSPTTDGRYLYVSFGSFGTYCYDLDGKLQWQRDLGRLNTRLGWGEAVTPVIHGDALLLNWDQERDAALICLDAKTGKTRWQVPRDDKTSWNTPLVVKHRDRYQVIVNGTKRIRSYDLATGAELWQCGGMTTNAIPSPVAADGVAYCMSGYGAGAAVAVPLDSKGDLTEGNGGKLLWRHDKGTPYVPSPLLAGDQLYFTHANIASFSILDLKTGKALLDRGRLPGVTNFYGSPIAAAGRIYLVDRSGTTLVLRQADRLEVLATNVLDDPIDASPAAVGRHLFLRGEKYLYCIGQWQGDRMLFMEPTETAYDLRWRMLGTDVRVHPMFWLVSVVMGWNALQEENGLAKLLIWIGCVFVSILIHELGHVWMGQAFGSHGHIVLYGFGGLAIGSNRLYQRGQRIAVSFAGPLAGFVFLGLLLGGLGIWNPDAFRHFVLMMKWDIGLADPQDIMHLVRGQHELELHPLALRAIEDLIWINLFWGLVNLLPVWPLDGGMIAREICEGLWPAEGLTRSLGISLVVAGLIAVHCVLVYMGKQLLPLKFGNMYIALLFALLAVQSYQLLQQAQAQRRWNDDHWDDGYGR